MTPRSWSSLNFLFPSKATSLMTGFSTTTTTSVDPRMIKLDVGEEPRLEERLERSVLVGGGEIATRLDERDRRGSFPASTRSIALDVDAAHHRRLGRRHRSRDREESPPPKGQARRRNSWKRRLGVTRIGRFDRFFLDTRHREDAARSRSPAKLLQGLPALSIASAFASPRFFGRKWPLGNVG